MAPKPEFKPYAAFDAQQMERYWRLENAFLAAFAENPWSWETRRNRALLSSVMFGGVLNRNLLEDLSETLGSKLQPLVPGGRLAEHHAHSVLLKGSGRCWFADPLTKNLLRRRVSRPTSNKPIENDASECSDYTQLVCMEEAAFIDWVNAWVIPAATTKARLFWPSLVVGHCTGTLQSISVRSECWESIDSRHVENKCFAKTEPLERIRTVRPKPNSRSAKYYWFKDKGFHFIREAIVEAIDRYAEAENPTLRLEQTSLQECLGENRNRMCEGQLGWQVNEWFRQYCRDTERDGASLAPRRARTLLDHAFSLGCFVDWSAVWHLPKDDVKASSVAELLNAALAHRPEGYGAARRLYAFLGFGPLPRPRHLPDIQQSSNVKTDILSGPEFRAFSPRSDSEGIPLHARF